MLLGVQSITHVTRSEQILHFVNMQTQSLIFIMSFSFYGLEISTYGIIKNSEVPFRYFRLQLH